MVRIMWANHQKKKKKKKKKISNNSHSCGKYNFVIPNFAFTLKTLQI